MLCSIVFSLSLSLSLIDYVMAPKQRKSIPAQSLLQGFGSSSSSIPPVPSLFWFRDEKAKTDFIENFEARGIHLECQVFLSDFSDTTLPDVIQTRDGNGVRRGRRMGSSSPPRMVLSCPIPTPPRMMGKTFPPHPHPLGPRKAPPHPVKLYFLIICPTTSTIFFNETYFIDKNILEITTEFIPSNQINF